MFSNIETIASREITTRKVQLFFPTLPAEQLGPFRQNWSRRNRIELCCVLAGESYIGVLAPDNDSKDVATRVMSANGYRVFDLLARLNLLNGLKEDLPRFDRSASGDIDRLELGRTDGDDINFSSYAGTTIG